MYLVGTWKLPQQRERLLIFLEVILQRVGYLRVKLIPRKIGDPDKDQPWWAPEMNIWAHGLKIWGSMGPPTTGMPPARMGALGQSWVDCNDGG